MILVVQKNYKISTTNAHPGTRDHWPLCCMQTWNPLLEQTGLPHWGSCFTVGWCRTFELSLRAWPPSVGVGAPFLRHLRETGDPLTAHAWRYWALGGLSHRWLGTTHILNFYFLFFLSPYFPFIYLFPWSLSPFSHAKVTSLILFSLFPWSSTIYTPPHPLYPPLEVVELIARLFAMLWIKIELILSICYNNASIFIGAVWCRAGYCLHWVLLILISPSKVRYWKCAGSQ